MKEKLTKLIDVKSIVTFAVTGAFVYLAVIGKVDVKDFIAIVMLIYGFYFGAKSAAIK